jgi:hypothetical protein
MKKQQTILLFNQKQVRREWDEETEQWYFAVVDVISILTDSTIPKRYWSDLKSKLITEGSEVYGNIVRLKMVATDGKQRLTDAADTQTILRLI